MIVCHCAVVRCRDVAAAMADGARTTAEVCRRTGAAQTCGGCVLSVRQLVCQHQDARAVHREESLHATS